MRRIEFAAAPPADVAVLTRNLELWPVLREVVEGYSVLELETIKTPLNLRDVMRVLRHVVVDKASVGYASMAARLHRSGVKVLLAVDQTAEVVEELGRLLPDLRQVVIAHGSVRTDEFVGLTIRPRAHRVLAVWGESDRDAYARTQQSPVDCRVIGSLRNAHYLSRHSLNRSRIARADLLLVSQYSGIEEEEDPPRSKRNQILKLMNGLVRQYCLKNDLTLSIALRPPASSPHAPRQTEAELAHFEKVFAGLRLEFSDPRNLDDTYRWSDSADVTVGAPKGTLTESFARGNKVLMICQSPESGDFYGFPLSGPWLLYEPTYEQFAERLDMLRAMRREDAANQWRRERMYMVANAESDEPISLVRRLVSRAIRGEPM